MLRRMSSVLVVSVMTLVAGCASEQLLQANNAANQGETSSTSAYGGLGASKQTKTSAPFNPFADHSSTSYGGRQIISNPSMDEVMKVGALPEMSLGRGDAPVTIVKYASLTCPYCRKFQKEVFPQLKRDYIDRGKVRFIIREFPIGRSSGNATIALRCARPETYFTLYSKFLEQQGSWVSQEVRLDAIHKVAAQVGLSRAEFDACLKNQAMIEGLEWIKDRGRTLGVIGTPNFFVQNKLVKKVLTYADLKAMIDPLLGVPVAAQNTADTR
ncbi:Disulfide bond formation protein DsbD [Candidatus Filomicrobium marinum]|uniref:Disulfide bond formation protein DsbD n=2 Tax=Candidatus Filomicrobium marinum TaxID=1608628 RepID=A0A0D6JL87_9HYPH|nr:Disulfide bond formation protein DsbD [Candidatus Filomicrobium marinum]CPR22437.1 Disulfide bond formation protein DsbD [Candidatus Filomicrobium marinum]